MPTVKLHVSGLWMRLELCKHAHYINNNNNILLYHTLMLGHPPTLQEHGKED